MTDSQQKQASAKFLFPLPQKQLDDLRAVSRRTKTPVAKAIRRAIRTDAEVARLISAIGSSPQLALRWLTLMESVASDPSRSSEWQEMARVWSRIVARVAGGEDALAAMREIGGETPGFYEDEPKPDLVSRIRNGSWADAGIVTWEDVGAK